MVMYTAIGSQIPPPKKMGCTNRTMTLCPQNRHHHLGQCKFTFRRYIFAMVGWLFVFLWYKEHTISFQTFFVWALLLIVHTWNSSPLRSSLLRLQCTCCTVPTTSGRLHGSPLVWACQWPSSQPLSSQLSHNDSL